MTPAIQPNPRTWILRFKHHKSTIILHVDPLQDLTSVRAELLKALHQSHSDGKLNEHRIPDSADDILLARPIEPNDPSMGWEQVDKDEEDLFEGMNKGKAKAGKGKGKGSMDNCPQGAGLRDGGMVAFRFKSESATAREGEAEDGALVSDLADQQEWDVILPFSEEGDELGEAGLLAHSDIPEIGVK